MQGQLYTAIKTITLTNGIKVNIEEIYAVAKDESDNLVLVTTNGEKVCNVGSILFKTSFKPL